MARGGRPPFLQQVPCQSVGLCTTTSPAPSALTVSLLIIFSPPPTTTKERAREGKPFFVCSPRPACWLPPPPPQVSDSIPPKDVIRRRRPDRWVGRFSNIASRLRTSPHLPTQLIPGINKPQGRVTQELASATGRNGISFFTSHSTGWRSRI